MWEEVHSYGIDTLGAGLEDEHLNLGGDQGLSLLIESVEASWIMSMAHQSLSFVS